MILEFEYQDAEGVVSIRRVSNFSANGTHFQGFDIYAKGGRTFRREGVRRWLSGGPTDLNNAPLLKFSVRGPAGSGQINTAFTGFGKVERATLEASARTAGHLVRSGVTGALTYLCTGPNAGAAKIAQARAQGAQIVTKEEFERIIAH